MAKRIANVAVETDTLELLILKTNEVIHIMSNDALTANATYANTGNSSVSKVAQLYGTFGANNLAITNSLRGGNVSTTGLLTISSSANVANSFTITGATTLSNTIAVTGNSTFSNSIAVTGNTTLSNTIAVTGNATFSNSMLITGPVTTANSVTIDTDYMIDVMSNTNIGTNIATPVLIHRFAKSAWSSGKIMAQVTNNGNTQISEMVFAHDGTTAELTTFATIASPSEANTQISPLGTFQANVNNANVEIHINQTVASSAVKLVAHLIK